ncbi:hypothetical protein K458DRAFT_481359 [Lentithecium fluviatile CBS 122367]|uniref:Zn(2)-C6 fungal-type domain-containing protein n=1 Tax=Lentithecium fluviatile CBS 122367 TaxID=1168545 RepID=A0A6G1IGT8_9PLEO|nr:hypothetical protein K458DRAFT_481359 [Lentithecium fluviatile CBS 122367]
MEDTERPAADKAVPARVSQACQRCRSLKTRCLPSERSGTCRRCLASMRDCVWAEIPRRPRRVRGPSRISQIEQKIDGLVAGLGNPDAVLAASAPAQETRTHPTGSSKESPALRRERPLAPGSWVPFPTSFAQEPVDPGDDAGVHQDAEPTQQFLEKLRDIHNFGENDAPSRPPNGIFDGSHRTEPGIENERVKNLIANGEADGLLDVYRSMCTSFPFVPLAPTMTGLQLEATKPMLFLAMITVASWKDHRLQLSLDETYRTELAHRTIIRPRKTLSLLQSILVYLSRYHFVFSHKTQQLYTLQQLAVGMALDMGLHQRSTRSLIDFPGRPPLPSPSSEEQRERQRTFLGCYYLSSMVAGGLQKPNLLRYTDYMAECSRSLKQAGEFSSDALIGHLISLSHFDDQIHDSFFTEDMVDLPLTDARIMLNFRFTESLLDEKKRECRDEEFQRVLDLSSSFTDMQLHSIALRPSNPSTVDSTRMNTLLATLEACKRYLDTLLAFPVSDYHLISFAEWMRLPSVIMTLSRLCMPNDSLSEAQWDIKMAHDRSRLDLYLDSLCYRMQGLTACDRVTNSHMDFWFIMRMILELTRTWYLRKINLKNTAAATATSALPTPNTVQSSSEGTAGAGSASEPLSRGAFGSNVLLGGVDMGGHSDEGGHDPFSFMNHADFDMDKFFDMGLWGDESYVGMGFGGGMHF